MHYQVIINASTVSRNDIKHSMSYKDYTTLGPILSRKAYTGGLRCVLNTASGVGEGEGGAAGPIRTFET